MINWPRKPELEEFEAMADRIIAAGYYRMEELMDTPAAERPRLYKTLADVHPGWARLLRKMLDAEAPSAETEPRKSLPY